MDYKAALPKHNSNVSHDHPLIEFVVLACGVVGFLLIGFWALGFFVDGAVEYLSPEIEGKLFAKLSYEIEQQAGVDLEKKAVVQSMVDLLGSCIAINYPLKVVIVKSKELNAFAFPGGYIVVSSGILKTLESENGLSFVLAHELAHFKNRDHLRSLGRGVVLAGLSAMVTGADSGVSRLLAPTGHLGQAQLSQSREAKADILALEALNCRYGHVGGAIEFFELLQNNDEIKEPFALHYFASHPELGKRIESLKIVSQEKGFRSEEVSEIPFK